MKIIQLMPEFELAGAEIMAENLTYFLARKGHDVIVVSMYTKHTPITDRLEKNGIRVVYLDKKSGFDIGIIFKMRKLFRDESPDIIHTHRYLARYAIPAAILAKVGGRVHTVHNMASKELGSRDRKFYSFFYKRCNMYPVGISPRIKATIAEEYGINENDIGMAYNGINISDCIPKTDYSFENEINILHVGRFNAQKNHKGIIRAFSRVCKEYPNARLNLWGTGELKDECVELARELSISDKVIFCGTTDDMHSVMSRADMFILCSHYEGMPITLIEAMATALPIVATSVGGVVDMIDDGINGLLCNDTDDDISQKIIRMISDEDLRRKCGSSALEKSKMFSAESMAEEYLRIYAKVLG